MGKTYKPRYHSKRVLVSKEFTFDAAHNLIGYEGACERLHGHTYKLIIGISGVPDDNLGMVIDFKELKRLYQMYIEPVVDHQYLNETLPEMNTTAENMVVWLFNKFQGIICIATIDEIRVVGRPRVEFIKLYETPTSYAVATREWMEE